MGADCDIRFENAPDKIVYGGQQIAGVVDIHAHNVIKVKRLVLYIEGVGECEWREERTVRDSDGRSRTEYTYYRGRDQYMNTITHLIPNETEIQPGRHTYNFMFQVPPGTPSSVQERNGRIWYRVRVVFDRPWKFDLDFNSDFAVVCPIDLNFDPGLRMPLQQEEMKTYCCLFCASEPVILSASIPQSGYVVGQPIPVKIMINNPSNVDINHVELTLIKHVTYTSDSSRHHYGQVELRRLVHGSSFSRCKKEYNIEMDVPYTVPSTNNPMVRVINIYYVLHIKAKTPGCHMSPSVSFPIVIGTVPIGQQSEVPNAPYNNEFTDGGMMMPPQMNQEFQNVMMPPSAPMTNNFPPMMPPSAPMNNDFQNPNMNMMPPIPMLPSAPQAPPASDLPPSFEEATKLLMPSVNAETSASYSGQPMGFVIPSNDVKKS